MFSFKVLFIKFNVEEKVWTVLVTLSYSTSVIYDIGDRKIFQIPIIPPIVDTTTNLFTTIYNKYYSSLHIFSPPILPEVIKKLCQAIHSTHTISKRCIKTAARPNCVNIKAQSIIRPSLIGCELYLYYMPLALTPSINTLKVNKNKETLPLTTLGFRRIITTASRQ